MGMVLTTHSNTSMRSGKRLVSDGGRIEFAFTYYRHLKKLREYIYSHLHEPIRLSDAANSIGISPSRLSHLFHDKTGMRYRDWICAERIRRAQQLLCSMDRSICDVAYLTGFRNTRSFERAFKKVSGISASEYRKIAMTQNVSHK